MGALGQPGRFVIESLAVGQQIGDPHRMGEGGEHGGIIGGIADVHDLALLVGLAEPESLGQ